MIHVATREKRIEQRTTRKRGEPAIPPAAV
jgi:3-oxoacid CoA-transferase subunit A